jgi:hypothetical protein
MGVKKEKKEKGCATLKKNEIKKKKMRKERLTKQNKKNVTQDKAPVHLFVVFFFCFFFFHLLGKTRETRREKRLNKIKLNNTQKEIHFPGWRRTRKILGSTKSN